MANVMIKQVPDKVLKQLRARARAHGHSLQDEILTILTSAATIGAVDASQLAEKVRKLLAATMVSPPVTKKALEPNQEENKTTHGRRSRASTNPTQVVRKRKAPL